MSRTGRPVGRPPKRERTPFSASRKRLAVRFLDKDFEKKYFARWFNDQDGRVERAEEAGYEFVQTTELAAQRKGVAQVGESDVTSGNTDIGSKVSRVVGRTNENAPIRAFLMKLRREWYDEDQKLKEQQNRLVDDAIRAGKAGGADIENKYGKVRLS